MKLETFDGPRWAQEAPLRYAEWVGASAAGIIAELCAVLALPETHEYFLCAGWMGGGESYAQPMCYEDGFGVAECSSGGKTWFEVMGIPRQPAEVPYYPRERALRARRDLCLWFYTQWVRDGGFGGPKYWSVPFCVPKSVPT